MLMRPPGSVRVPEKLLALTLRLIATTSKDGRGVCASIAAAARMKTLVFNGALDRIDDDHVDGRPGRLQLQAELFLQRREDRHVVAPFHLEVVASLEPCAIE